MKIYVIQIYKKGDKIMKEVKWSNRFNIGVDVIDKAHQKLFSIVGKLIALNEDETKQQHACCEGIKYLKSYTIKHFAEEEAYMKSIGYEGYDIHKQLHDNMRNNTLPALEGELERQNYSRESVRHFLGICIGWLNAHTMIEDPAIVGRASSRWVHHSSDNTAASVKKAIIQAAKDMFRLDAQVVSEHYSGEDFSFGNTLCYRMKYISSKEQHQIFLSYEQRLVLSTLGGMLGREVKTVDKTVAYTIKVLSQKFVERIGTHFISEDEYQLEKNDMLTFEQLLRVFDREYPSYNLLFSTGGKGYFAVGIK